MCPLLRVSSTRRKRASHGSGEIASLIDDVEHKLFDRLPDDTWFYPGHRKESTLGRERPSIPEWRARGS
jgi:glyoxylase-like metal-dependent hydrolase (beta-lactamase superfamily II)